MSLWKKILALIAPVALLSLSACATGFHSDVQRFSAMPAPEGQSFVIKAANPANNGGLEFSMYANQVREHMIALGFAEAPSASEATLVVSLDYGVDGGRERVVSYPDPFGYGFGYGYWPGRYGYWGGRYRSPFYWGWNDPWLWGGYGADVSSCTVYTSFLGLDIRRTADGQSLFEG